MKMQLENRCKFPPTSEIRRFRGCLFGVAVGDALGAPVEGLNRKQIAERFGRINDYILNPLKRWLQKGQWTDDTALTLATAESLVEKQAIDLEDINEKMRLTSQLEPERGYGLTTRNALAGGRQGRSRFRASNGVAMRIAPIALYSSPTLEALRLQVEFAGRLTHQNPDSINAALAIAFAIASAARGELEPPQLIQKTIDYLRRGDNVTYKLQEVQDILARPAMTTEAGLDHIGTRGNALETIGSAFYAFLRSPNDFRESVTQAVNAGGDSDTIGSITGALSGAYNGFECIPHKWANRVEARTEIDELSRRLFFTAWHEVKPQL